MAESWISQILATCMTYIIIFSDWRQTGVHDSIHCRLNRDHLMSWFSVIPANHWVTSQTFPASCKIIYQLCQHLNYIHIKGQFVDKMDMLISSFTHSIPHKNTSFAELMGAKYPREIQEQYNRVHIGTAHVYCKELFNRMDTLVVAFCPHANPWLLSFRGRIITRG